MAVWKKKREETGETVSSAPAPERPKDADSPGSLSGSRGMGGHSLGGRGKASPAPAASAAQMNLYSAFAAGSAGDAAKLAGGPAVLQPSDAIRFIRKRREQFAADHSLSSALRAGTAGNPLALAGSTPTLRDTAEAFHLDPDAPVPEKKLWRRTEEPSFNGALQTGQADNPLFLAGAGPTPIDLMRDHYNERVPKPPQIGEQTFAEGGQFDAQSGRTYFSNNGNPVWAQVQDLEGIGVLPDGSVVGHLSNDRFARPLYEIIKARDTGEMDPIDAAERIDMLAWDMALQAYPEDDERDKRVQAYKDNLRRFRNRKLEYYDIPDMTEWFDELLQEESQKFFARAKRIEENGLRYGNPEQASQELLLQFIKKFKNGGDFDLKQSQKVLRDHSLFVYNGEIVSRDAFANILYGYIMKKAGYSDLESQRIAGAYQKRSGTSSSEWGNTDGDDPRDRQRITEGIRLYLEREGK